MDTQTRNTEMDNKWSHMDWTSSCKSQICVFGKYKVYFLKAIVLSGIKNMQFEW